MSLGRPNLTRTTGRLGGELLSAKVDQRHELVEGGRTVRRQLLIGDSIDLPADTPQLPVATLIGLGVGPSAVPGDMVDLAPPPNLGERHVAVHGDAVGERAPIR